MVLISLQKTPRALAQQDIHASSALMVVSLAVTDLSKISISTWQRQQDQCNQKEQWLWLRTQCCSREGDRQLNKLFTSTVRPNTGDFRKHFVCGQGWGDCWENGRLLATGADGAQLPKPVKSG